MHFPVKPLALSNSTERSYRVQTGHHSNLFNISTTSSSVSQISFDIPLMLHFHCSHISNLEKNKKYLKALRPLSRSEWKTMSRKGKRQQISSVSLAAKSMHSKATAPTLQRQDGMTDGCFKASGGSFPPCVLQDNIKLYSLYQL